MGACWFFVAAAALCIAWLAGCDGPPLEFEPLDGGAELDAAAAADVAELPDAGQADATCVLIECPPICDPSDAAPGACPPECEPFESCS